MTTAAPTRIDLSLNEWETREPENGPLAGFAFETENARIAARELTRYKQVEFTELRKGLRIRTGSFVGQLQLDGLNLTIRPKLPDFPLAVLLRYAYGFRRLCIQPETHPHLGESGFQEMLVRQLVFETRELLSRGLHRNYERRDEALGSPRGRINFAGLARSAGPIGERLVCTHYPRSLNHVHNQVLKSGLGLAATITLDLELRSQCRRLADLIGDSVEALRLSRALMQHLERQTNRLTAAYRPALDLIRLLFAGRGMDLAKGDRSIPVPGFLFDMNPFFQAVISRFLHDHLDGCEVRDEFALRGMMTYRSGWNPSGNHAPTPRPDFVVMQGSTVVSVLDAKYRDLSKKKLPREMLYQLAIYALSRLVNPAWATILYPTTASGATEARIDIQDPLTRSHLGTVALRPVNLLQMAELIEAGDYSNARKARAALARGMAFDV